MSLLLFVFTPRKKQEAGVCVLRLHAGGRGSVRLQGGRRLTYLLTPVTFDRDYSALQIIHRQGSIIIEAESESRKKINKINESWEDVQENVFQRYLKLPKNTQHLI